MPYGRPKLDKLPVRKQRHVALPEELDSWLKQYSMKHDIPVAVIVRISLEGYRNQMEKVAA
jgi:predicted DNA-binding protein